MTGPFEEPAGATPLSPDDRQQLLIHLETRDELNEVEQANIQEAQAWLQRQRNAEVLDDHFLRELHRRMFRHVWGWAGQYRLRETNIGVAPHSIAVALRDLVADTRTWIEFNHYEPVELAMRFHHRLVSIHPFPNGNGRHARLAADALLTVHFNKPRIDWARGFSIDAMGQRRQAYLSALRAADNGDFAPLKAFVGLDG